MNKCRTLNSKPAFQRLNKTISTEISNKDDFLALKDYERKINYAEKVIQIFTDVIRKMRLKTYFYLPSLKGVHWRHIAGTTQVNNKIILKLHIHLILST